MPAQLQAGFVKQGTPRFLLFCHVQYLAAAVVPHKIQHDMGHHDSSVRQPMLPATSHWCMQSEEYNQKNAIKGMHSEECHPK